MRRIMSAVLAGTMAATSLVSFSSEAAAGDRRGRYERNWDGDRHHRRHRDNDDDGAAIAAGVIGLILGAAIASSAQPSAPVYQPRYSGGGYDGYDRYDGDSSYDRACAAKYWSYDPSSGTYLAANGYRYQCQL